MLELGSCGEVPGPLCVRVEESVVGLAEMGLLGLCRDRIEDIDIGSVSQWDDYSPTLTSVCETFRGPRLWQSRKVSEASLNVHY